MNKFDNLKTQKAYELDYLIAQKAYELDCLRSYRDIIDHHYVKNAILHVCPELCDNEGIEEMTREEAEEYIRECLAFDDEDTIKIIKALEQTSWIPISKRLPEIHQDVLLSLRNLDIEIGFRSVTEPYFYCPNVNGCYIEPQNVLAWQPKPEPYHEKSEDEDATKIIKTLEQQHCEDVGELSDGYHTFNQLYHQRAVLFACIVKQNKNKAWKSFKHSDGKYCFDSNGEWFIVGVDTPQGSYTYHYAKEYWDMFDCQELECGKEWDGHTEEDVTRLLSLPYIENDDEG
jgi:hypothetical protein